MIYCGIDWAEKTHDVALVNDTGELLAKRRITDDAAGYTILLDLLAEFGDTEDNPIPIAIETSRGLLVAVLRTGIRQVYAINPMAAARYRDRTSVSCKKSDPGDALVLANILRTEPASRSRSCVRHYAHTCGAAAPRSRPGSRGRHTSLACNPAGPPPHRSSRTVLQRDVRGREPGQPGARKSRDGHRVGPRCSASSPSRMA